MQWFGWHRKGKLRHMFYAQRVDGEKLLNATFVEMQVNWAGCLPVEYMFVTFVCYTAWHRGPFSVRDMMMPT